MQHLVVCLRARVLDREQQVLSPQCTIYPETLRSHNTMTPDWTSLIACRIQYSSTPSVTAPLTPHTLRGIYDWTHRRVNAGAGVCLCVCLEGLFGCTRLCANVSVGVCVCDTGTYTRQLPT